MSSYSLSRLSSDVLLQKFDALIAQDCSTTAALLAYLAEVDVRRLHVPAGYPSLRTWCVGAKRMSDDVAAKRIRAARAARRCPAVLPMLEDGRLTLSAVLLLARHLTPENADDLLAAATHQTNEGIGRLLAERFPQPDRPTLVMVAGDEQAVRPVGELSGEQAVRPVRPPTPGANLTPLSSERIALQVTIGRGTHDKLRYAQDLLGHAVPSGDLSSVLDRALDALIALLEKKRFAATSRPRPSGRCHKDGSRHIPNEVKRMVWQRDGGQCTFVSDDGHRCEARSRLQFDHIEAFARGGQSTPGNLCLRCQAHNQFAAERTYGADFMQHKRDEAKRAAEAAQARERELEAARKARVDEVIPWLCALGIRIEDARRAIEQCGDMPGASLEERIRVALKYLLPRGTRTVSYAAGAPA